MTLPGRAPPSSASAPPTRLSGDSDILLSLFLALLLATTALDGILEDLGVGGWIAGVRLAALATGVLAVWRDRTLAMLAALAAVAAGAAVAVAGEGGAAFRVAALACFGLICAALLRQVFRPGRITVHRLLGAVAVYVLLAGLWGTAYQLLIALRPEALRGPAGPASAADAMWLSFVTLTTTGYGDVLPASAAARSLAAIEGLTGVLYPAILISRLVSLVQVVQGGATGGAPAGGEEGEVQGREG
jgi:hypothetical protein